MASLRSPCPYSQKLGVSGTEPHLDLLLRALSDPTAATNNHARLVISETGRQRVLTRQVRFSAVHFVRNGPNGAGGTLEVVNGKHNLKLLATHRYVALDETGIPGSALPVYGV